MSLWSALRRRVAGRAQRGADDRVVRSDDVTAGFRLILGRAPDPAGLQAYAAMVGTASIEDLATALVSSEEFRGTPMYRALERAEDRDLRRIEVAGAGFTLFCSEHDLVNRQLLLGGAYEPRLTAAIREVLRPGMTFCDVGANVGYYANLAARAVGGEGRVLAFEARPANAQLVLRSAAANGHACIEVLPFALGERRGLYRYVRAEGTNGYIEPLGDERSLDDPALELVPVVPLDEVLGSGRVDVMKLDVEGAEGLVLRGAQTTLARCRPVVFSELSLTQLERTSGMTGEACLAGLRDLGYRFDVLAADGDREFGDDVAAAVAYARSRPVPHVDLRCRPG